MRTATLPLLAAAGLGICVARYLAKRRERAFDAAPITPIDDRVAAAAQEAESQATGSTMDDAGQPAGTAFAAPEQATTELSSAGAPVQASIDDPATLGDALAVEQANSQRRGLQDLPPL